MGNIRKIGDIYYIEFYARGLLYSQIAGPDLESARRLLEITESKISQGEALTVERTITLTAFFDQYESHIVSEFSAKTILRYRHLINHFSGFLYREFPHISKLSEITPHVCEAYRSALVKDHKPALVNFSLLLLRDVMDFGIKIAFINDNPTIHLKLCPWPHKEFKNTARCRRIKDLFQKNLAFGKVCQLIGLNDIARLSYFKNLMPAVRPDIYS